MKKIFLAICILFLSSLSIYADLPKFEEGTVISLNDYSQKFKDNIILVNYSGLNARNSVFAKAAQKIKNKQ